MAINIDARSRVVRQTAEAGEAIFDVRVLVVMINSWPNRLTVQQIKRRIDTPTTEWRPERIEKAQESMASYLAMYDELARAGYAVAL